MNVDAKPTRTVKRFLHCRKLPLFSRLLPAFFALLIVAFGSGPIALVAIAVEPPNGNPDNEENKEASQRFQYSQPHLGTTINFTVYAPEAGTANQAARSAFDEVRRLDRIFSTYRSDSELAKLHQSHWSNGDVAASYPVSREFAFVLGKSLEFSRNTGGTFDATVGPYSRIWKRAIRHDTLPEKTALQKVAGQVGFPLIELISQPKELEVDKQSASRVRFLRPNMRLDFSAIAKGYIADKALTVFRDHGLSQALVDAGGDLAVGNPPPKQPGWSVSVKTGRGDQKSGDSKAKEKSPATVTIFVRNCGIATSGDAFQRIQASGQRHSHIIDPRTGDSVTHGMSVTVMAADAMTADVLASALSVAGNGSDASQQILAKYPNSRGLFVSPESGGHGSEVEAFREGVSRYNRQIADSLRP